MTLLVHVVAGCLGLGFGYVALYAAKGATLHRKSGMLFVYVMLGLSVTGAVMAVGGKWQTVNVPAAVLTAYLVVTALTTVRPPAAGSHWLNIGAMFLALAVGLLCLAFGLEALAKGGNRNGVPAFAYLMFAVVGLLGGAGDIRMIRSEGLRGAPRLARHLWRMCFALYIAAASFLLGPTGRVPEVIRIPALLPIPVLVPLLVMLYWLWRLRIRRAGSALEVPQHHGAARAIYQKGHASLFLVLTTFAASAVGLDAQYKAPANEFGQPDLQGVWNFSSDVPLERAKEFADKKFFTRDELAKQNIARETTLDRISKLAPVEVTDRVWLDYKGQAENLRTSLIIYPENGRVPELVEGVRRVGGLAAIIAGDIPGNRPVRFFFGGIGKEGPEDRGLAERCLVGPNARPPLMPGFDSNYVQIFQTTDHVSLLVDTFHGTRMVPLDGRPHLGEKLRSWSGDSRGRWEGETLVVETMNFNGLTQSFNDAGTSYDEVVTERFTRVSENVIEYEATVVDPKTFQDKVVLSFPMAKVDVRIYETACHEGNYSMTNTLAGARTEEQEALKAKR